MASKKTLNASNLEALGAPRLAELLMELGEGNAAVKRRLRLELAGASSPDELIREIRKRLATIARARSFVDWQGRKALIDDLEAQRRLIVERVAKAQPAEGLDLIWRFLELAGPVLGRSDDNGTISGVFRTALGDLDEIARAARPDPRMLADQVFRALTHNDYGQFDGLIPTLAPALGPEGLEHLKQSVVALSKQPVPKPPARERKVIGWGTGGVIYADSVAEHARVSTVRHALQDIADAQGDVDAFVAQYDERARKVPSIAAEIAQRLLAAKRAEEALRVLDTAKPQDDTAGDEPLFRMGLTPRFDWEDARIAVLDALGRGEEAQNTRWSCFERFLSARHLRAYLKQLPDFDDVEAETRALDFVERSGNPLRALAFLIAWPAPDRAARLVIQRAAEWDGDHYEILTHAAETLAGRYPLAATLLLRSMIDFALTQARHSRYGHAARHLRTCEGLAAAISDFGAFETHDAYVARLREQHGRKSGFWSLLKS